MSEDGVVTTKTIFDPEPKNPVLICGLPGSGYVGKLAIEQLISVFHAKRFKEFHSPSFPPQANVGDDGIVHQARGEFYFAETGESNDLLLFTADAQPTSSRGDYELSDIVLRDGKRLGASLVISLAAYITGDFAEEQKVFGACSSKEMGARLSENGVKVMKEGAITGMNGLVLGMASLEGMDGICLLGETSGYMVDPSASQRVLEALARILKMEIDLATLTQRALEAKELMGEIQKIAAAGQMGGGEQEAFRQGGSSRQPGYIG